MENSCSDLMPDASARAHQSCNCCSSWSRVKCERSQIAPSSTRIWCMVSSALLCWNSSTNCCLCDASSLPGSRCSSLRDDFRKRDSSSALSFRCATSSRQACLTDLAYLAIIVAVGDHRLQRVQIGHHLALLESGLGNRALDLGHLERFKHADVEVADIEFVPLRRQLGRGRERMVIVVQFFAADQNPERNDVGRS